MRGESQGKALNLTDFYVQTLTNCHEFCVINARVKLQIQEGKISFIRWLDRVTS